jgi:hypothetical protein
MNTDIAYKGLKYIIIWTSIYFVVKYISNEELYEIDIALMATVLTLLLCILEIMYLNNYDHQENMTDNIILTNNNISDTDTRAKSSDAVSYVNDLSYVSSMPTSAGSTVGSTVKSATNTIINIPNTVSNMVSQLTEPVNQNAG